MLPRVFTAALLFAATVFAKAQDLPGLDDAGEDKAKPRKVAASIISEVKVAAPGQPFRVAVKLDHDPHHHTYGKVLPADGTGLVTKLDWALPDGWKIEELPWPEPKELISTGGAKSLGYEGIVYLPARVTPAGAAGTTADLSVNVSALVCDPQSCMPIRLAAKLTLPLAATAEPDPANAAVFAAVGANAPASAKSPAITNKAGEPQRSFVVYLLFAFIGGLILNVMPCVFPVLGIKVLGVVQQAGEDRRQVVLHGLAYTLGVLVMFWALGLLVISLGKGWGFQLQSPGFVFSLAVFFMIFALNMAGVFEIGASAIGVGAELQSRQGLGGSFFSGLLATIVATPCSAPFLGTALPFAVSLPAAPAMLMFSSIGMGLASPFLLLSIAPDLMRFLPRPGAWMESFKQGLSFLLFGTVGYMVWVLTGMMQDLPMLFVLLALVLVSLGCWIYGRWSPAHLPTRTRRIGMITALMALVAGMALGWPRPQAKWEPWSPQKVAELRAARTPVYIDFTAQWCLTCQVNKRVYKDAGLKALFEKHKVALLKADWTNEDETIRKALTDLGKAAVPVNVLYIPGREEPHILPELLTVENVTVALKMLEQK